MSAAAQDYACSPNAKRRPLHRLAGLLRAPATRSGTWLRPRETVRGSFHAAAFAPASGVIPDGATDFSAEAHTALARVKAYMPGVRLQFAAEPGLFPRIDQRALGQLLDLLLGSAAEAAPSGRILLGAMSDAGFIRIVVLDEGVNSRRDQVVRQAAALAARHRGSLEMESAGEEGTTAVLRLPAV